MQTGLQRVLSTRMGSHTAAVRLLRSRAVPAVLVRSSSSNAAADGAGVAPPDIKQLAKMAQIGVTDEELKDWEPKISSILDWFGQLQAVDVSGVPPAVHARDEGNVLRADEPQVYANRQAIISQVPEMQGGLVRVPKISTGADSTPSSSTPTTSTTTSSSNSSLETASSSSGSVTSSAEEPSEAALAAAAVGDITEAQLAQLQALDIRVGRIISCEQHPDADSLYVEKIDVGEPEPRTIVSGLVKYVPLEEMQSRPVIVLCNLKPRNMRGIKSSGMLLAASNDAHDVVEPLAPAAGAAPGTRVWFGQQQEQAKPMEPNPLQKKKVWEGVQPLLRTDGERVANFKGAAMRTAEGPVTSSTLTAAHIG